MRLITPPALLLTTALLSIYSAYAFLIGAVERSITLILGGALSVIATYGVAMMRPWSRFLVYLLTAGFLIKLLLSLHEGWQSGFFEYRYASGGAMLVDLLPTAAMAILSALCCWLVCRQFNGTRHVGNDSR